MNNNKIRNLRLLFCAQYVVAVVLYVTHYLVGTIDGVEEFAYPLQMAVCLLTVVSIPVSVKWLFFDTIKRKIRAEGEEAYCKQSLVAILIGTNPIVFAMVGYLLIEDSSMLFCAVITAIASWLIWPSRGKMEDYMFRLGE